MRASRARLLTAHCHIWRAGAVVSGKAGPLEMHLDAIDCTPLMPLSAEAALRAGIETPSGRSVLYVDGTYDIRNGDVAEFDGKQLPIVACSRLPDRRGGDMLELIVQVVRTERH